MAKQTSLFLPVGANNNSVTIVNADGTSLKTLFTAGANDSDVKSIVATSSDTVQRNLSVYVTRGGTDYLLGTVPIYALSGTDGAATTIDVFTNAFLTGLLIDNVGKYYMSLKSGDVLKVGVIVAVTAAKTITVSAFGQDY